MQKVDLSKLPFGRPLPADLYDADGTVYRRAGEVLERFQLIVDTKRSSQGLFVDPAAPEAASWCDQKAAAGTSSPDSPDGALHLRSLKVGTTLSQDIYDHDGVLLARRGTIVSPELINKLRLWSVRARGTALHGPLTKGQGDKPVDAGSVEPIPRVTAPSGTGSDDADRAEVQSPEAIRLDEGVSDLGPIDLPSAAPSTLPIAPDLDMPLLREQVESASEYYHQSIATYADMIGGLLCGQFAMSTGVQEIITRFAKIISTGSNLGPLVLDLKSFEHEYLFSHGLNVAILSMTVANNLGFSHEQVVSTGLGAMFQDLGMLKVPDEIRFAPRPLTEQERVLVEEHPIHTLNALESVKDLDDLSRLIGYQVHERCDRSGYPRRRHRMFINPLARVVAVADTYAAIASARPHRWGLSPYTAMTMLLKEAHSGRLDRQAVRAFLDTLSLFPIGSYVKLSDGTIARVLRSNGTQHTRPVVMPLNSDGTGSDTILDLSRIRSVQVVAAMDYGAESDPSAGDQQLAG